MDMQDPNRPSREGTPAQKMFLLGTPVVLASIGGMAGGPGSALGGFIVGVLLMVILVLAMASDR